VNGAKIELTITRACLHCKPESCKALVPPSASFEDMQKAVAAVEFDRKANKQVRL
jgi:hypothetical protein